MIVKNAEGVLARCLDSVRGVVDEIVIADTGSTDGSMEIARQYGANVFSIPWESDFAKARNRSLAAVHSDWVLMMDADEMLDSDAARVMPAHLEAGSAMGYTVVIRNYVDDLNGHLWDQPAQRNLNPPKFAEQYPGYLDHVNVRLFRRHADVYYQGAVHETVGYRLFELGGRIDEAKFLIHHFGFLDSEEIRSGKAMYYRELGRRKLVELPDNALAHYELGTEESEHFHDYEAALPLFRRACELNPRFGPAWLFYGKTLARLGKYKDALDALDRAASTSVRKEALLEAQGDVQYSLCNFEETARAFRQVLEILGSKPEIESKLGFAEVRQGRTQEGLDRLRSAVGCEPGNAGLHDRLISAHVWLGDYRKAAEAAEDKLKKVKPQPESFLRAACLRAQLQEWHETLDLVRSGLDRFPEDGKLQEAFTEATRAVAAEAESEGDAQFQAQDFEGACRWYQQAMERLGDASELESKLGLAEVRGGHVDEGLAHLKRAVERDPQSSALHDRLVAACTWLGRIEEAARAAENKLACVEPASDFFLRAASLHARLGNWPRVASLLGEGLGRFPNDPKLLRAAAEVRGAGIGVGG